MRFDKLVLFAATVVSLFSATVMSAKRDHRWEKSPEHDDRGLGEALDGILKGVTGSMKEIANTVTGGLSQVPLLKQFMAPISMATSTMLDTMNGMLGQLKLAGTGKQFDGILNKLIGALGYITDNLSNMKLSSVLGSQGKSANNALDTTQRKLQDLIRQIQNNLFRAKRIIQKRRKLQQHKKILTHIA